MGITTSSIKNSKLQGFQEKIVLRIALNSFWFVRNSNKISLESDSEFNNKTTVKFSLHLADVPGVKVFGIDCSTNNHQMAQTQTI
jgi:hypothetical protein